METTKTYDNGKQKNNKSPLCDICQKANGTIIHTNVKIQKKYGTFEPIIK